MTLQTVNSTAIHAVGYDRERREMEIVFNGGGIYLYEHVPQDVFLQFMRAPSKGTFFLQRIRGRFRHQRLGRWRRRKSFVRRPSTA